MTELVYSLRCAMLSHVEPVSELDPTWDLGSIFPTVSRWHEEFETVQEALPELASFKGRVLESAEILKGFLELDADLGVRVARLGAFASLSLARDAGDPEARSLQAMVEQLAEERGRNSCFFGGEVLGAEPSHIDALLRSDADLERYRHLFDVIERYRPYVRGSEVEQVLASYGAISSSPKAVHSALHDSEMTFDPIHFNGEELVVSHEAIETLMSHPARQVRQDAYESYAAGYSRFRRTLGEALIGHARASSTMVRLRGFSSAYDAALFQDGLSRDVFEAVTSVCREYRSLFHRYFEARARLLGLDRLAEFDLAVPLATPQPEIRYERAVQMVISALAPLGEKYAAVARQGMTVDRWAEVYPGPRKASTPFSAGTYGTRPFMLLNYTPTMKGVGVLAHELGHSMHSYIAQQHQPPCYASSSSLVGEMASNLNQVLLRHAALAGADATMTLAVLDEAFFYAHRYLFVMPTLSEVEDALYSRSDQGRAIAPHELSEQTVAAFREAYGGRVVFDAERLSIKWAQFPHFYQPYYLFKYAIGMSAAMAIGQRLLAGDEDTKRRYLRVLALGSAQQPVKLYEMLDVDISSPALYEGAFGVVEGYVERLEEVAGSRGHVSLAKDRTVTPGISESSQRRL